jgi:hypothetical protein
MTALARHYLAANAIADIPQRLGVVAAWVEDGAAPRIQVNENAFEAEE